MAIPHDFTVRPDSKGRITLGELAHGISSFRVSEAEDGCLVLKPYKEIPAHEAWLFENKIALNKVRTGLKEAAEGKLSSRGSFSQFLDNNELN